MKHTIILQQHKDSINFNLSLHTNNKLLAKNQANGISPWTHGNNSVKNLTSKVLLIKNFKVGLSPGLNQSAFWDMHRE